MTIDTIDSIDTSSHRGLYRSVCLVLLEMLSVNERDVISKQNFSHGVCVKVKCSMQEGSLRGEVKHRGKIFNKGGYVCTTLVVNVRNLILSKLGYSWGVLVLLIFLEKFSERQILCLSIRKKIKFFY